MQIENISQSRNHYKWVFADNEDEEVSETVAVKAIELLAIPNGEDDIDIEESGITLKKDNNGWWIENI